MTTAYLTCNSPLPSAKDHEAYPYVQSSFVDGITSDRDALVRVTVEDAAGKAREVEAVLDTGFNGSLALPPARIKALGLARKGDTVAQLASGEERRIPTYRAMVVFGKEERPVTVAEAGEALAGMALLWGRALRVECREGGRVEIKELP